MTTENETAKERRRKSVYTDKLGERVCQAIAMSTVGIRRMVAADKTLPSESTIYLWVQQNDRFAEAYKAARKQQADRRIDAAQEAFEDTKAEVRALLAENTKMASDNAKILLTMVRMEMAMQQRIAAWLAPRSSGKRADDDGGPWIGDIDMAMPDSYDDLIC